jgi:deferrochelatase/peroxidase EfeB
MYIINYDTSYCKGHLWILIHSYSEREAIEKLHSLIDDVSNIRSILKQF